MDGFTYVNIFATKGLEYIFVFVYLVIFIFFIRAVTGTCRKGSGGKGGQGHAR